jgi:hypothetical protein
MANTSRPSGFKPVQHLDGSAWNGKVSMFLCPSTTSAAIYIGDAVVSGGTAGAAGVTVNGIDCEGMSTVAAATAGGAILGVCVGVLPLQSDLSVKYRKASTSMIVLVVTDPSVVYEVQEDNVGNDIAVTQVGNNFDLAAGAGGSTTTGISGMLLDSSDGSGTASATFRLLGLVKRPDNALGTAAKWLVTANEHEFKSTTGV